MTLQRKSFPIGGRGWDDLKSEMMSRSTGDIDWRKGRTPLFVFYSDEETYEIGKKAFFEFFTENALGGKRAFHSIGGMERDILDYGLSLFSAPEGAEGAEAEKPFADVLYEQLFHLAHGMSAGQDCAGHSPRMEMWCRAREANGRLRAAVIAWQVARHQDMVPPAFEAGWIAAPDPVRPRSRPEE